VVDQPDDPWAAWGQMLPSFFQPEKVVVANYAESGETAHSFIGERRLDKVLSLMKAGDYLFIEFAHNDQKEKGPGVGAFTSYKKDLKFYISEARKKGGIPILVTSMNRRNFDSAKHVIMTLGDYPAAMRETAQEENVQLIDLNYMSKIIYEAWGPEESKKAFVIYPANTFPGQTKALEDNTHFNPYGAYEIARCIVYGMQANKIALANYLGKDIPPFDPAKPDMITSFIWPYSPKADVAKPDGN
jgi:lysophospholipase L1-like esterase